MFRGLFGRRARSTWTRLIYLCLMTIGFLFVTSQFKQTSLDARVIPETSKKKPSENPFIAPVAIPEVEKHDEQQAEQPIEMADSFKNNELKSETTRKLSTTQKPISIKKEDLYINGQKYPKLNSDGKFIPQRRIIHLDLKGAPYKVEFFPELFSFFNRLQATGILIEWEDMFPFKGRLSSAVNKNAYSMEAVESILGEAKEHHLQIIPLVQTLGHLEWILKLEQFAHLREDSRFPQVICFSDDAAWDLIKEMIEEVGDVHKKYGMPYFHIGADEAFQIGICNASVARMTKEGSRERLMLWHMARTAKFTKEKYPETEILAWHDMLANAMSSEIEEYGLTKLIQPVLWNYAEDLDMYLPRYTWMILKNFGSVWGSSAYKGADGPARYCTHAQHYIKNHESWTNQFTLVYQDFNLIEGIIMTGWSRYDHLAVLAELLPVSLPTLAMSMETIMEGRSLKGDYPVTAELIQCSPPIEIGFFANDCRFPGRKIYELVNELYQKKRQLKSYRDDDFEYNGWLSRVADEYSVSSHWYIDKIEPMIEMYATPIELITKDLTIEMEKIFYQDAIDEFIFTYIGEDLEWIKKKREVIDRISKQPNFPARPFVTSATVRHLKNDGCKKESEQ